MLVSNAISHNCYVQRFFVFAFMFAIQTRGTQPIHDQELHKFSTNVIVDLIRPISYSLTGIPTWDQEITFDGSPLSFSLKSSWLNMTVVVNHTN